jgi:hypothetical protein
VIAPKMRRVLRRPRLHARPFRRPAQPLNISRPGSDLPGRRLKLRVSYTRSTWGLAKRCAALMRLLGSARLPCSPVRTVSPLLCESPFTHGPGSLLIVSQHPAAAKRGRKENRDTMHFALLALSIVLSAVAVLFAVFFLVRRWL